MKPQKKTRTTCDGSNYRYKSACILLQFAADRKLGRDEVTNGPGPPPQCIHRKKKVQRTGLRRRPFQMYLHASANIRWNSMGLSSWANLLAPKENTMFRSTDKHSRGAPAVSVAFITT
mmetsp:Transcript_11613/g.71422  ORF Transcript_11613/g.71422 Transcript_11613/m.71422 type:complete len:118 (-) Transcript_11613:676-1029(-)